MWAVACDADEVGAHEAGRARRVHARQKLGLSVDEFSTRLGIPIDMLRAWERHQAEPDVAARAHLDVIAEAPDAVAAALQKARAA